MVEQKRKLSFTGVVAGLVLVAGAAYFVQRHYETEGDRVATMRSAQAKVAEAGPRVEVIKAAPGPEFRTIKLLGDVKSAASVTLYAKVSGYLKSILVDKGDVVAAGQLIAELESPERLPPPISSTSGATSRDCAVFTSVAAPPRWRCCSPRRMLWCQKTMWRSCRRPSLI